MVARRKGSVRFEGTEAIALSSDRIARLGVAFCPEERGIFASLNVHENLLLPPAVAPGGLAVEQVFELFPNLKERLSSQGTKLSGGEQQMLAIGRILRTGARLLLARRADRGPRAGYRAADRPHHLAAQGGRVYHPPGRAEIFVLPRASPTATTSWQGGRVVDMIPNAELESSLKKVHEYLGV